MSREIIQFDRAMFESKLNAMVREKVEWIVNAMPDASGGRDRQRREIRAFRRTEGVQGRPLRAEPDRQGRQARAQGAEIEGRPVRVRGDRTLPQTRGKRRGGADRHVPGRRVHPAGRRHRPVAVGRPHAVPDIERQAQARVRRDRRMAHGAVGGRVPIRVRGRRVAQALLGRKRGERRHPGRHRRQQGWSPRGRRRRRGPEGGFRQLGAVLSQHDRTRSEGRPARGRRPVHGTGRHGGLDAAEGENIIVYSPGSNAQMCHETGVKVLLNDSPFMSTIPAELIEASDVLLVNEHEMAQLLGIDEPDDDNWGAFDWRHAADRMAEYGFKEAIVTLVATVLWCWTPQLLKASGLCASLR